MPAFSFFISAASFCNAVMGSPGVGVFTTTGLGSVGLTSLGCVGVGEMGVVGVVGVESVGVAGGVCRSTGSLIAPVLRFPWCNKNQ
jgi:hypothetical protein